MRPHFLVVALALGACVSASSAQDSAMQPGAAAPASMTTPVVRTALTLSGQPLKLPQGPAEMVAAAVEIPVGGTTTIHQHPWSRFVYVEKGPVRITNQDTGEVKDLEQGTVFAEVVSQWHYGTAPGSTARLIVIDIVPPGVNNMIMRK